MASWFQATSQYLLMPKRDFVRFACGYEILPRSLCYQVNDQELLTQEHIIELQKNQQINDKMLVLELVNIESFNAQRVIPYSALKAVGFINQDVLEDFLERVYSNNDYQRFSVFVLPRVRAEKLALTAPETERDRFTDEHAKIDALIALYAEKLRQGDCFFYQEVLVQPLDFQLCLKYALGLEDSINLASTFFDLCCRYNISVGWRQADIFENYLQQFKNQSEVKLGRWGEAIKKILNGETESMTYCDEVKEETIILRAITLTLFNPTLAGLDAMKANPDKGVGEKVFKLAKQFVLARQGYSHLNAEQKRQLDNEHRRYLQDLNAFLSSQETNKELHFISSAQENHSCVDEDKVIIEHILEQIPVQQDQAQTLGINLDEFKEDQLNFVHSVAEVSDEPESLNKPKNMFQNTQGLLIEKERTENHTMYEINGLKPYAGYDLKLFVFADHVFFRISTKPITAPIALKSISIQTKLPYESRFEYNDEGCYGVKMPLAFLSDEQLKENLLHLLGNLSEFKLIQKLSQIGGTKLFD